MSGWAVIMPLVRCHTCGQAFYTRPSRLKIGKGKFCSRQCYLEARDYRAEKNPFWGGGQIKRFCINCGKEFTVKKAIAKTTRGRFCSHRCWTSSSEYRQRRSMLNKQPEFLNKVIKGWHQRPTRIELILQGILDKYFPHAWRYTGDGSLVVGGFIPDFANSNGRKVLIEVFGDYWHGLNKDPRHYNSKDIPWHQTELGRIMTYNSLGFSCLVIWEHELKDEDTVVRKIKQFIGAGK